MLRHRNSDRVELGRDSVPIDTTVAAWTGSERRGDSLNPESRLSKFRIGLHGVSGWRSGTAGATLRVSASSCNRGDRRRDDPMCLDRIHGDHGPTPLHRSAKLRESLFKPFRIRAIDASLWQEYAIPVDTLQGFKHGPIMQVQ